MIFWQVINKGIYVMKRIILSLFCLFLMLSTGCQEVQQVTDQLTPSPAPPTDVTPAPSSTTTPDPTATPNPTPTAGPIQATVAVAGDLLCLSAQISDADRGDHYSFDACFDMIKDKLSAADLTIGNLETLVADGHRLTQPNPKNDETSAGDTPADGPAADPAAAPSPTKRPSPRINAPEAYLTALQNSGFDVLTTANNHMFDYREDGLTKTLNKLDEFGFAHTGAYVEEADKTPLIRDANGIQVAVLAYTDILNHRLSSGSKYMIDVFSKDLVTSDIAAAKAAGADYVIVCVHWGVEHTHKPNHTQRTIAKNIAEAGADIIFGSHPHCTQPFEVIETENGNVPVLYSLGNFISSMSDTKHKDGVLVNLVLEKDPTTGQTSAVSLTYTPTLCVRSSAANYTVYPADAASISGSDKAQALAKSRERTISVLTENVATAE